MNESDLNRLRQDRLLIGILRGFGRAAVARITAVCARAGLKHLEITMNSPGAPALIGEAIQNAGSALRIGAGTVLNERDLDAALGAGATFIVSPVVNTHLIRRCVKDRIPVFPGAFSPAEIRQAWDLGATLVKIFPADFLGPSYIKNLRAPMPELKLLPTGGITLETIPAWIAAGADGFGVGSPLFDPKRIQNADWEWLTDRCRAFLDAANPGARVSECRGTRSR